MREFINRYGVAVIAACLVVAAIIYLIFGRSPGRNLGNPSLAYYINDVTGAESVQPSTAIPPLMDSDGKPDLVMEVKVSCSKGKNPRLAYLRKYSLEAQAKIKEIQALNDPSKNDELQQVEATGELVRLPQSGSPWVQAISEEGEKVRDVVKGMCKPGENAVPVSPQ